MKVFMGLRIQPLQNKKILRPNDDWHLLYFALQQHDTRQKAARYR